MLSTERGGTFENLMLYGLRVIQRACRASATIAETDLAIHEGIAARSSANSRKSSADSLLRDGVLFRAAAVLFGHAERLEFEMPQCLLRVVRFRGLG